MEIRNQILPVVTKDYWPTYKPFYDDKIVMNINQKVNSKLKY